MLSMWLRTVAAGAAWLALAAAGQAQEAAATSAECFDAGLFKKGAVIDYDIRVKGGLSGEQRERAEVGGAVMFNGFDTTKIALTTTGDGFTSRGAQYVGVADGALLLYGFTTTSGFKLTSDPPEKRPIAMSVGETFKQTLVEKTTTPDGDKRAIERKTAMTFVGFETLKLDFGTFKACKFSTKVLSRAKGDSAYQTSTDLRWTIADARYRGLVVKGKFGAANQSFEVLEVRTFAPK